MIINIRGTSGSGKSTLVKRVMRTYPNILAIRQVARRQPLGYLCRKLMDVSTHNDQDQVMIDMCSPLYIVGHYETACGGCDTISGLDDVYKDVMENARIKNNVLYEGIMVSGESRRFIELHQAGFPVTVIALDVPIENCLASIQERRNARGDERPLNPDRTVRRLGEVRRMMEHLKVAGIPTYWLDREAAYHKTLELLRGE
jgi:thymidylate kinase